MYVVQAVSLRTSLLAVAEAARKLSGPTFADIRVSQLTIRKRVWSGGYIADGTPTDTDLVLPAHYPVRYVSGDDVEGSGGKYQLGDVKINHITPFDGISTGYTVEQLDPTVSNDRTEVIYILSGPMEGEYALVDGKFDRPFSYTLFLRNRLGER